MTAVSFVKLSGIFPSPDATLYGLHIYMGDICLGKRSVFYMVFFLVI